MALHILIHDPYAAALIHKTLLQLEFNAELIAVGELAPRADDNRTTLLAVGGAGSGKTTVLGIAAKTLSDDGHEVLALSAESLGATVEREEIDWFAPVTWYVPRFVDDRKISVYTSEIV